jgi:hypothetical protein
MERDDDALTQALAELLRRVDPCPPRIAEAAGGLLAWGGLDADLEALLRAPPKV